MIDLGGLKLPGLSGGGGPHLIPNTDPPPVTVTGHTTGVTPDGSGPVTQAPIGATTPDLIIMRQQTGRAGGGGITVGTIAILALLGVGGWFVYKRMRGN